MHIIAKRSLTALLSRASTTTPSRFTTSIPLTQSFVAPSTLSSTRVHNVRSYTSGKGEAIFAQGRPTTVVNVACGDDMSRIDVDWQTNSESQFLGTDASGNKIMMSGSDEPGIGPMKMLLMAVGGCASVDLITILKKQRQKISTVSFRIEGQRSTELSRPFESIHMTAIVKGENLDMKKVEKAVELSIEKYCGVHGTLHDGVKNMTWGVEIVDG
ncbi:hypothetical protein HDU76_013498 [Blyttiomyces sp. JEL0837]|nr:hypothetical protein HDU76_013498 [Blyttiomyces sp. JEL0837]